MKNKKLEKKWKASVWTAMPDGFRNFIIGLFLISLLVASFFIWVIIVLLAHWGVI